MTEKHCMIDETNILRKLCEIQPEKTRAISEIGFSQIFSEVFPQQLCYNSTAKSWYFYDGTIWKLDEGGTQAALCARALQKSLLAYGSRIENDEIRKKFVELCCKYSEFNRRENLVKDSRSLMSKTMSEFDTDTNLLNCLNGTLNLQTGEFYIHRPSDYLTKVAGCDYDSSTSSEKWEKFIFEIMQGDVEKIAYLQRLCGYFLTDSTHLETAFFFYGKSTRNGKSTFCETMRAVLGDYSATIPPEILAQTKNSNGEQASPHIAKLAGIRFLNIAELPQQMLLNGSFFKTLTGGEKISTRKLYANPFDYKPQFKIVFNTNYLPLVTDNKLFDSDRVRIITFDRHFSDTEQNKNLKRELQEPEILSSILNWCLQGLNDFKQLGECPPDSVKAATKEYEHDFDKILQFVDDCLIPDNTKNVSASEAFKKYCEWCRSRNFAAEGKTAFFDGLKTHNLWRKQGTVDGKTVKNIVWGYKFL